MTKAATKDTSKTAGQQTGMIRNIPLSQLDLSPLNPRRNVTDEDITALADSIRTAGLLQNLAGIETETGRVEIVAGGRRLRALFQIADESGNDR